MPIDTFVCKYERETPEIHQIEAIRVTDKKAFYKCPIRGEFSLELSCDKQEIKMTFKEAVKYLLGRLIDDNEYFNDRAIYTEFWAESIRRCNSVEEFNSIKFDDSINNESVKSFTYKRVPLVYGFRKVKL